MLRTRSLTILLCAVTGFCLIANKVEALPLHTTATYYSDYYNGRQMANRHRFSQSAMVAAHPTIRLGTRIRVQHRNRSIIVTVTDRCLCTLDLSKAAFKQLAPLRKGRIPVKVTRI